MLPDCGKSFELVLINFASLPLLLPLVFIDLPGLKQLRVVYGSSFLLCMKFVYVSRFVSED